MARNRILKVEFWSDVKIGKLDFGARLLYMGMWNFADDYGVISANPRLLLGQVFENDMSVTQEQVEKWLSEIEMLEMIQRFTAKEKDWYFIKSWNEHQKIFKKSERRNPEPPLNSLVESYETVAGQLQESAYNVPNKNKNKNENKNKNNKENGKSTRHYPLLCPERDILLLFKDADPYIPASVEKIPVDDNTWFATQVIKRNRGQPINDLIFADALRKAFDNLKSEAWFNKSGGLYWLLDVKAGKFNGENCRTRIAKYLNSKEKMSGKTKRDNYGDGNPFPVETYSGDG